ncbi:hypothetical protein AGR1B_pa0152 [Agrobacterium fabacearum S56]|nr:hypothetical protein AGR1B_pa0152 [Agrobacterium fabacearum S56]
MFMTSRSNGQSSCVFDCNKRIGSSARFTDLLSSGFIQRAFENSFNVGLSQGAFSATHYPQGFPAISCPGLRIQEALSAVSKHSALLPRLRIVRSPFFGNDVCH